MKIAGKSHVAIEYALTLDSGEEVDRSEPGKPLEFICGIGQIVPGLERQLEGKEPGDKLKVVIEAAEGYGPYNEAAVHDIPRAAFPDGLDLEPGMVFQAHGPHGPTVIRVKQVKSDVVVSDFNHPLAGERLHFDVNVVSVRDATADELASAQAACSPAACAACGCSDSCED